MHDPEVHSVYMQDPRSFVPVRARARSRRSVSFSPGCQRNTYCAISIRNRVQKYKTQVQEVSNAR